jgi:hypothetical protein
VRARRRRRRSVRHEARPFRQAAYRPQPRPEARLRWDEAVYMPEPCVFGRLSNQESSSRCASSLARP